MSIATLTEQLSNLLPPTEQPGMGGTVKIQRYSLIVLGEEVHFFTFEELSNELQTQINDLLAAAEIDEPTE